MTALHGTPVHEQMYDPWHDLVPGQSEPPFDASKTALVTIDMQYFDAHPDGWMGRVARELGRPEALAERWRAVDSILPRIRALQDACRGRGMEQIHMRIGYLTRDCRDGARSQPTDLIATRSDARDYEFLHEVAPQGDEIVISKTTASAFSSTIFDQVLRNLGISRLIVAGIVTNGCVELTARDATDRGYDVTIVEDACAASTAELHDNAIARFRRVRLMRVHDTDYVVRMISSSSSEGALFKGPPTTPLEEGSSGRATAATRRQRAGGGF